MLKAILQVILRGYQSLSYWLLRRVAPTTARDGIRIIDATAIGQECGSEEALYPVLEVLKSHDHRRYSRLARVMPEIVLMPISGAEYHSRLRSCYLGRDLVTKDPVWVASLLVHESTHAYLRSRGCSWTPARYQRIEEICIREQIRFARRAGASKLEAYLLGRLAQIPPVYEWDQTRLSADLAKMPHWFRRLYAFANQRE